MKLSCSGRSNRQVMRNCHSKQVKSPLDAPPESSAGRLGPWRRSEFFTRERFKKSALPAHYHGPLLLKTVTVLVIMVVLFLMGQPVAKVAIVGGAFLLLTRRVKPQKIYREIDWPLLVMFVGLFVVVAGFEKTVLTPEVTAAAGRLRLDDKVLPGGVTALLPNVGSNLPA